jgi:hypothetical protein
VICTSKKTRSGWRPNCLDSRAGRRPSSPLTPCSRRRTDALPPERFVIDEDRNGRSTVRSSSVWSIRQVIRNGYHHLCCAELNCSPVQPARGCVCLCPTPS